MSRSGLLVVDKPGGLTSHDVVGRVRRLAGTRKVGHAGTLDPMATGVLVIGVGRATRLLGHLMLTEKAYDTTIRLGETTSTDDAEGEPVAAADASGLDEAAVREALAGFVGEIQQRPSAVSAIKVDGKRAYQRVRDGEAVELPARPVTIHELVVARVSHPGSTLDVDLSVRCSSGTYIRAIARDLGEVLGVGGHLTALRRTAVGPFTLADARTLDQLAESFDVLGLDAAARRGFASCDLTADLADDVRVGRRLPLHLGAAGPVAVFAPTGEFLALYEQRGDLAHPVAVFVG
ncbi:tRNA pseudouridine(55) synthase TruB [Nocardioides sp.]|uniref:tRNA pseudouridine(55) synthase TruB n=1 Tax=Nocardioides sp. TaxID=35761 RepID=UPI0035283A4B